MFYWLSRLLHPRKVKDAEAVLARIAANHKTIDDYRERFATAPLGKWSHAVGTFGNVMDEIWEFRKDYSGVITETGPFGGARGETLFEWKPVADFTIVCKVTKWSYEDDEDFVADEGEEPETWQNMRYDFKITPTDCGELVALVEVAPDGTLGSGFWLSLEPLSYAGNW